MFWGVIFGDGNVDLPELVVRYDDGPPNGAPHQHYLHQETMV